VVNITYQRIDKSSLIELLGVHTEKDLSEWMRQNKWKETNPSSGSLLIASQEELIKTKNITEKIDFESVASILATYR